MPPKTASFLSISFLVLGQHVTSAFVPSYTAFTHGQKSVIFSSRKQDLFDAEEAAADESPHTPDPGVQAAMSERAAMMADDMVDEENPEKSKHEVNPMRVLYRAFKMAYDMMTNRRETLRKSVEEAREVEQQYSVMKRSADQLVQVLKEYEENPTEFKTSFVTRGKDEGTLAIEMLEKLIAYEDDDILELERDETYAFASFLDALEKEEMAEAREAKFSKKERAAMKRMSEIEDFADEYEVDERKRDMSTFHANKESEEFYKRRKSEAVREENEALIEEFDMKKKLDELKHHEKILKTDLEEVKNIVREQLRSEWEAKKNRQEMN